MDVVAVVQSCLIRVLGNEWESELLSLAAGWFATPHLIMHPPTVGWRGGVGLYKASVLPEQAHTELRGERRYDAEVFALGLVDAAFL